MQCVKPIFLQGVGHVPCGKCMACRISRTREWAVRILHEASIYDCNSFITLTYSDVNVPILDNGLQNLNKKHYQDFMKRYRKYLGEKKIKYYACGEYGEKSWRPHYHAVILGDRPSKKELTKLWGFGLVDVGELSYDSAAYVSGYVQKKLYGKMADDVYQGREPAFSLMSKNFGQKYIEMNKSQLLAYQFVTVRGVKMSLPRYYLKKLKDELPEELLEAKRLELSLERQTELEAMGISPLKEWKYERDLAEKRLAEMEWKQASKKPRKI